MKGLTLHEPWASAVRWDLKRYETRGHRIHYRGDLAICAAKTTAHEHLIFSPAMQPYFQQVGITQTSQLAFGCIVAVCRVAMVMPVEHLTGTISKQELVFGNYAHGRFVSVLADLKRLKRPIPFRGQQGLFRIPREVVSQMEFV